MKKALFAHDHVFVNTDDGAFYSPGKLPYAAWSRYFEHFDALTIACRCRRLAPGEDTSRLERADGPGVTFCPLPSLSNPVNRILKHRTARQTLLAALDDTAAVIARLPSEIGSLAASLARKRGITHAVEVVADGWDSYWHYGSLQGKLYAPVAHLQMRKTVASAPHAIYVTKEYLQRRYPCPGHTAAASNVVLPDFPDSVLAARKKRIARPGAPVIIGHIASLNSRVKGIDTAIDALARLRQSGVNAIYRILGEGSSEPWRLLAGKKDVADHVFFDGVLPGGQPVHEWLDAADIYIQPSRQEGLPRALIEAMGRGLPAFGASVAGIPELLDDDCLHKPGDSLALYELIFAAVHDEDWRKRLAERNFSQAKTYTKDRLEAERRVFWARVAADAAPA